MSDCNYIIAGFRQITPLCKTCECFVCEFTLEEKYEESLCAVCRGTSIGVCED